MKKELPVLNVTLGANSKMGPTCATVSRPTGETCPPDCPFLSGVCSDGREIPKVYRCYARGCELRRPNVRANWARAKRSGYAQWERETTAELIRLATRERGKRLTHFRPHVGGDICLPSGALDKRYLRALCRVCLALHAAAPKVKIWLYTHAWRALAYTVGGYRVSLLNAGVQVFASVHTAAEAKEAAALGFRLAADLGTWPAATPLTAPAVVNWRGHRVTVCPHQRGKVASCVDCGLCPADSGRNVGFILHK